MNLDKKVEKINVDLAFLKLCQVIGLRQKF